MPASERLSMAGSRRELEGEPPLSQQHQDRQWMLKVKREVAVSVEAGDVAVIRKALVLGDVGVNDALHVPSGHTVCLCVCACARLCTCALVRVHVGTDSRCTWFDASALRRRCTSPLGTATARFACF